MITATRVQTPSDSARYARCLAASDRIRWDIERDVIRGRSFDFSHHFLPEGLSRVGRIGFLQRDEQRLLSQIQGRTYANMFGLVERFIGAKMLEISRDHWFGDQVALQALVRFADEEIKHQLLFRRIEQMIAAGMPAGYRFEPEPNAVAAAVMAAPTWSVLALTCHIELFTQVHYRQSLADDHTLSPLFRDVFLHHWQEESQHAVLDELEWARETVRLSDAERDHAVDGLIGLIHAVDGIVQLQAKADAGYFARICGRTLDLNQTQQLTLHLLDAYRWQYIVSGAQDARFGGLLGSMVTPAQGQRITAAVAMLGS
jgi:hypothetical protein